MKTSIAITASSLVLVLATGCGGGAGSSGATGETPTPTATANPTPTANPATCRSFQIKSGPDGNSASSDVYLASALGNSTDASEFLGAGGWSSSGPLVLCAGTPNGNRTPLSLQSDVVVAISLPQSNCICRKYLAAGSSGTFYGGPDSDALDVTVTMNSNGSSPADAPTVGDGTGTVQQAGDMKLSLVGADGDISADASSCTADACASASFGASHPLWYTTGTATSQVQNPKQGGTVKVSISGSPFGADFSDTSVKGTLAGAAEQQEDNGSAGGDVATVERIAE